MGTLTFKSIYPILFAALLLLAPLAAGAKAEADDHLRVMTFNIRYNEPKDGENAWPKRKTKVADVIRFHTADLVGVQEAQIGQLRDLETLLPDYSWCGVGRADGKDSGEFSAILYRRSRFRLIETATFWLSETPEKAGSSGWDAAFPRIVTWARFRDLKARMEFVHFNTHFDHRGEKARIESAKLLVNSVSRIARKLPFVVTGDFNARESTDIYKILTGGPSPLLIDARYKSEHGHFGPTSTFNDFKELVPGMKIDYIFVNPGTIVFEHAALADRWDGLWASDHLPVLAEIEFGR